MAEVEISVSVAEGHLPQFRKVVRACQAAGLKVDQAMEAIGVITGRVPGSNLAKLKAVAGVEHVEQSRQFQLPPADADVQ